jgi:hypothetical protein
MAHFTVQIDDNMGRCHSSGVRTHASYGTWPYFASRAVFVGFVVDKVAVRQAPLRVLHSINVPYLLIYLLVYRKRAHEGPQFHRDTVPSEPGKGAVRISGLGLIT